MEPKKPRGKDLAALLPNESKTPVVIVTLSVFLFAFAILVATWIVGLIRTGGEKPAGCDVQPGDIPTFSCLLATDDTVRTLFWSWLSVYAVLTIFMQWILYHVPLWETPGGGRPVFADRLCTEACERRTYRGITGFYTFLTVVELVSLALVASFFVTDASVREAHYVFAGLAFGSHCTRCWLLFFRRMLAVHNEDYFRPDGQRRTIIFVANGLWCITQVIFLVLFAVFLYGWMEFILMMLLMLDKGWQLYDYHRDSFDTFVLVKDGQVVQIVTAQEGEIYKAKSDGGIPIPKNISEMDKVYRTKVVPMVHRVAPLLAESH